MLNFVLSYMPFDMDKILKTNANEVVGRMGSCLHLLQGNIYHLAPNPKEVNATFIDVLI